MKRSALLCLAAGIFALAAPAAAKIDYLHVPGEYATIQGAVDAASGGDVILVKKGGGGGPGGAYNENVVINKQLTLQCLKKAVIDVSETMTTRGGTTDYSAAITLHGLADGTVIRGCVIRFARDCNGSTTPACIHNSDTGDGIDANDADNVVIRDNVFIGNEGMSVDLVGDNVRIFGNRVKGDGGGFLAEGDDGLIRDNRLQVRFGIGVDAQGDRFTVLRNSVNGGAIGCEIIGDDGLLAGNTSRNALSVGHNLAGSGEVRNNVSRNALAMGIMAAAGGPGKSVLLEGNRSVGTMSYGISGSGETVTMRGNRSEGADFGIVAAGNRLTVNGNKAFDSRQFGLYVIGGQVVSMKNNRSEGAGTFGIYLTCVPTPGAGCGPVRDNTVLSTREAGIFLTLAEPGTVRDNVVRGSSGVGFWDTGVAGSTWTGNVSAGNGDDGFLFSGGGQEIRGNRAVGNGGDGIDVDSSETGFTVAGNTALDNGGAGIENDGAATVIKNNTARRNGIDIAGAGDETPATGTVATFTKNDFKTGGQAATSRRTGSNDP